MTPFLALIACFLAGMVLAELTACSSALDRIADLLEQQRRERLYGSDDKVVRT